MAVLVGIDEAGFGPLLGPLVVSSSTFALPRDLLGGDLWKTLRKSVLDRRQKLAGRLLIVDSKKAKTKLQGIKHLQRTCLACLKCLGGQPKSVSDLLNLLCPDCAKRLGNYPWYQNIATHELSADDADIEIASGVFADDLDSNSIKLIELESRCLDVAYYNGMVETVQNKSSVLFTATSQLIKKAWDNFGTDDLQIMIDRQGGRVHYGTVLRRMFPECDLAILKETPANSSYELTAGSKRMRLHFAVGADGRFLVVSLASMVSKYIRELLVANINRYFAGFHADLKPTAGYWKDGLRFIEDLKINIPDVHYDSNQLIRSR